MDNLRDRVMIWAPSGRDGTLIATLLERHGTSFVHCRSVHDLAAAIGEAGCAVVAQEALSEENLAVIERALRTQPAWSDFPFILLAFKARPGRAADRAWHVLGNVAVLERPTRSRSLLTAVVAALRARRRQYEAQQAILHRDQFLAMLGHELRNPLAAISLATEAERQKRARTPSPGGRARGDDVISIIARQARHLSHLVDDLLDVGRVTTGKVVLSPVVLDLNDVLARSLQSQELSARAKRIELRGAPSKGRLLVRGDAVRLEEVHSNLLANAIKYCQPGGRVEARLRADGDRAVLDVRDNGIGICPDMLPRVFDLFAQADVSLDRSRGGLGVGLTIVKALVEMHGGSVSAHSDGLGTGSTFSVQLPLLDASVEPHVPSSRLATSTPLPRIPVVVVDDNGDLLEMTKDVLEGLGCEVSTANDGPSGLARLREIEPALAFVDIGLPGLDGYQLARALREDAPRGSERPWLVAMTGYGQPEDRERAIAAGFDRHLTKPVTVAALRECVEEACRSGPARVPSALPTALRNPTETGPSKLGAH